MPIAHIFVTDQNGHEIDRIEYDAGSSESKAVLDVMTALNKTAAEARALVAAENPGAELSSEENARALADQIAAKTVPDRDADTYGKADSVLSVQDHNPTPAVAMSIVVIPATSNDTPEA